MPCSILVFPLSRRLLARGAVCALLPVFVGCHNNYAMPESRPPVNVPNNGLKIVLQTAPAVPRQMDPATFTVHLSDARGRPVDGAAVTADLAMPAMDMGANTVATRPQGAGVYVGTGRFSMAGEWNVTVTADKGALKSIQTVAVRVR